MSLFPFTNTVRVLMLTHQGLQAFTWKRSILTEAGRFYSTEQGLTDLDAYLDLDPDAALFLVADVIEEDFRLENIVHVRGWRDQRILLERKLAQFFRTAEYRAARVQGREADGRKNDRILFSALTNTEQISFWVRLILARKAPLKGVLSVPWLLESFAAALQLDKIPHLLMVNMEERSGLRQTFLQSGKLKFSRLVSLARIHSSDLAETISSECTHVRQYLERLKVLLREQPLDVHLFVQGEIGEEVDPDLVDTPQLHFHLHETGIAAAEAGLDPAVEDGRGVVFLALAQALRTRGLQNIYGSGADLRYHRLLQIRKGLIAGNALLFAGVLAGSVWLMSQILPLRETRMILGDELKQLHRRYLAVQQDLPQTPVSAAVMKKVVDSVDKIQQRKASPLEMLERISRALAVCPDIRVQKISWRLERVDMDVVAVTESETPVSGDASSDDTSPLLLAAMLAGKMQVTTDLEGIVFPGGGFMEAQQSVIRFIGILDSIPGMQVTPVVMPTETGPDSSIQAVLNGMVWQPGFILRLGYRGGA